MSREAGSWYADSIALGPQPCGWLASPPAPAAIAAFTVTSGWYSARHLAYPGLAWPQAARILERAGGWPPRAG